MFQAFFRICPLVVTLPCVVMHRSTDYVHADVRDLYFYSFEAEAANKLGKTINIQTKVIPIPMVSNLPMLAVPM